MAFSEMNGFPPCFQFGSINFAELLRTIPEITSRFKRVIFLQFSKSQKSQNGDRVFQEFSTFGLWKIQNLKFRHFEMNKNWN